MPEDTQQKRNWVRTKHCSGTRHCKSFNSIKKAPILLCILHSALKTEVKNQMISFMHLNMQHISPTECAMKSEDKI